MKQNACLQKCASKSQKRIFKAIWLMEFCKYASGAFFAAGTLFAFLRFTGIGTLNNFLYAGGAVFLGAVIFSFFHALKLTPDRERLVLFLAACVPGGAVALSAAECGDENYPLAHTPELPPLRYLNKKRRLSLLCAGALFAAGGLLVPVSNVEEKTVTQLDLKDETEKFLQGVDALQRISPQGEKKAQMLKKEFEETVRQADPAAPGRSYELLHQLNERLRMEAGDEMQKGSQLFRQLAALHKAASHLNASGKAAGQARNFSNLLKAMAQKDKRLAEALKKGGFDGAVLDPEQLRKLAAALGKDKDALARSLKDMQKVLENEGQFSQKDLEEASKELEEFIKENVPGCDDLIESLTNRESGTEGAGNCSGGMGTEEPGNGAPGRGRGDAHLEYSGYTPDHGARRADKKIRSHLPGEKEKSKVLGRFAVDTEQKEEKHAVKGGTLGTSGGHAGFQESTLHPAHRRAVKRYFDREKQ